MTKLLSIVGVLAITAGCGGDDGTDPTTTLTTNTSTNAEFSPTSGQWELSLEPYTVDECNMAKSDEQETVLFDLVVADEGDTFTLIEVDDGKGTFTGSTSSTTTESGMDGGLVCTLDDMSFICVFADMDDNQITTDFDGHVIAVLTYQISVDGAFTSWTEAAMQVAWEMSCEGPECEKLTMFGMPEMPCVSQQTGTLISL